MVEWVDTLIRTVGPVAFLVLGAIAFLEYLCPPIPGDTLLLLGGVYAVRGEQSWALVFVAIVLGSLGGALVTYQFGRWLGGRAEKKPLLGIHPERLHQLQARMRRVGGWLLLGNRFIPGVRSLIFVAAGAAEMPLGRVLALGTFSAAAHTTVVLALGAAVGGNLEKLEAILGRYQRAFLLVALVLALGIAARWLFKRYRRRARV